MAIRAKTEGVTSGLIPHITTFIVKRGRSRQLEEELEVGLTKLQAELDVDLEVELNSLW